MNAVSPAGALLDSTALSRPGANPDGALIDICSEYIALERSDRAERAALVTEEQLRAFDRTKPLPWTAAARNTPDKLLMRKIAHLPALTPAGIKAKAAALVWMYGGDDEHTPAEWNQEEPLFSLLRDITGSARA